MTCRSCCRRSESNGTPNRRQPSPKRRAAEIAGGVASSIALIAMPKCPACLAAYVALWTGLGLSLAAATFLRSSLLIMCVASLVYVTFGILRRFVR